MSVDVNISNVQDPGIRNEYQLTKNEVTSANIANIGKDDASKLLGQLVKYIFINAKGAFKDASKAQRVQTEVPLILQLPSDAFDSDEELSSYKEYMRTLLEKAGDVPIITAIEKIEEIKGAFAILGAKSKNSAHQKIEEKNITFRELITSPETFGYQYEVGAGEKEETIVENKKTTNLMNAIDKGESLFERNRVEDAIKVELGLVKLSIRDYYAKMFKDYGFGDIRVQGGSPFKILIHNADIKELTDKVFEALEVVDYKDTIKANGVKTYSKGKTELVAEEGKTVRRLKRNTKGAVIVDIDEVNDFKDKLLKESTQVAKEYLSLNAERLLGPYMQSTTSSGTSVNRQILLGDISVEFNINEILLNDLVEKYSTSKRELTNKTPNQSEKGLIPFTIKVNIDEKLMASEGVFPDMEESRTIGGIKRGYASLRRMVS